LPKALDDNADLIHFQDALASRDSVTQLRRGSQRFALFHENRHGAQRRAPDEVAQPVRVGGKVEPADDLPVAE
jgi:hypothetical protein